MNGEIRVINKKNNIAHSQHWSFLHAFHANFTCTHEPFNPLQQLHNSYHSLSSFYRRGDKGNEKFTNLPLIIQITVDRATVFLEASLLSELSTGRGVGGWGWGWVCQEGAGNRRTEVTDVLTLATRKIVYIQQNQAALGEGFGGLSLSLSLSLSYVAKLNTQGCYCILNSCEFQMGQSQLDTKQKGLEAGRLGGEEKWRVGFPLSLVSPRFFLSVCHFLCSPVETGNPTQIFIFKFCSHWSEIVSGDS